MNFENLVKSIIAITGTLLTTLLGGWDMTIQILVTMIILDYLTGVVKAFINKKASSQIGVRGIVKKVMIIVVVAVAAQLDKILNTNAELCRTAVTYFYIANEGISLLENLSQSGVPLPKMLTDRLIQLKNDVDNTKK